MGEVRTIDYGHDLSTTRTIPLWIRRPPDPHGSSHQCWHVRQPNQTDEFATIANQQAPARGKTREGYVVMQEPIPAKLQSDAVPELVRAGRRRLALSGGALLLLAVAEVMRVVRVIGEGAGSAQVLEAALLTVGAVTTGVGVIVIAARHRNTRRMAAIQLMRPNAFRAQFFCGANLLARLTMLRHQSQITGKLPLNTLVGVSADDSGVRFFSGGAKPRLLLSLPSTRVWAITAGSCDTVRGPFPCVNITMRTSAGLVQLPLLLSRTTAFRARAATTKRAETMAVEMSRHVTGR